MIEKLFKRAVAKKSVLCCLPTADIVPNPHQPRRDFDRDELAALTESIKSVGLLQPITVRKRADVPTLEINGVTVSAPPYEIIAGERRWRACKALGIREMPCLIYSAEDGDVTLLALIENIQRSKLGIFEEAEALCELITESGISQSELAKKLSVTQACLSNKLRILKLGAVERAEITAAGLGERHARAFLRIESRDERLKMIRRAADRSMSAAETERMIDLALKESPCIKAPEKPKKRIGAISDIKFFYNTIDRAIATLGESGIQASCAKNENGNVTEVIIRITSPQPKPGLLTAQTKNHAV